VLDGVPTNVFDALMVFIYQKMVLVSMSIITVYHTTHILENVSDVQVAILSEETIAYQLTQIVCTLILQEDALIVYKVINLCKVYAKMFISASLKSTNA